MNRSFRRLNSNRVVGCKFNSIFKTTFDVIETLLWGVDGQFSTDEFVKTNNNGVDLRLNELLICIFLYRLKCELEHTVKAIQTSQIGTNFAN